MTDGNAAAHAPTQRDADRAQAQERSAGQDMGSATGEGGLAVAVLGLQRTAGNAAVVQLLRQHGSPAAPTAAPPQPAEREEAAPPLQPAPAPSDLLGDVPALAEGQSPTKTQRAEKRAQGDAALSLSEEQVAIGGGGQPAAGFGTPSGVPPLAGAFVDRGRRNTIAFGEAGEQGLDREGGDVDPGTEDLRPRVFIGGGRTGKAAWGGGAGAGPHGNQDSGSAELVSPEFETSWGGAFANADAWVKDGDRYGHREPRLRHQQTPATRATAGTSPTRPPRPSRSARAAARQPNPGDLYADKIQPMLDRILMSYAVREGEGLQVGGCGTTRPAAMWTGLLPSRRFDEDDKAWNGKGGQVDQEDQFSPNFPRQIGPGKVNGKEFTNRLKMPSEEAPPE